jgi:hypothetical protein
MPEQDLEIDYCNPFPIPYLFNFPSHSTPVTHAVETEQLNNRES